MISITALNKFTVHSPFYLSFNRTISQLKFLISLNHIWFGILNAQESHHVVTVEFVGINFQIFRK